VSMSSRQLFDDLLAFDQEAVPYCEGISDASAREYARNYMRRLQSRAKGLQAGQARISAPFFGPNRNLIEAALTRMYCKHFPASSSEEGARGQ